MLYKSLFIIPTTHTYPSKSNCLNIHSISVSAFKGIDKSAKICLFQSIYSFWFQINGKDGDWSIIKKVVLTVDASKYYLIGVMFGRFVQLAKTAVQRTPLIKNSAQSVLPTRAVQLYPVNYAGRWRAA
jgi:hypothetical protein